MPPVQIVTDSTALFSDPAFPQKHGVTVVPLGLRVGTQKFLEGPDLTVEQFHRLLAVDNHIPVSIPPAAEQFAAVYSRLLQHGNQIVSIHVSGHLSPTVQQAQVGSETLLGRCKIEIIDSLSISAGVGVLVETAALAAERGAPLDEVVRLVRRMIPRLYAIFFVENMHFLARAGQVSQTQAILSAMLGLKPFLTLEDGQLVAIEKVRTRLQALEKLVEFAAEFSEIERLAVLHGWPEPASETRQVRERLLASLPALPDRRWQTVPYGPTLATLLGPQALGVIICEGEKESAL